MTPLVSVVIPSYNQAQFLEETIRSVLEQDYPNLEVMVIDGGSTDESAAVIKRYADRLAYWVSEKDKGQADAINKGWARVTGDIVTFLNSDDFYYPGTVRKVVDTFEANPDAGLVYGMANFIDAGGAVISRTQHPDLDGQLFLDEMAGLPQPATFMRRAVIDKVGVLDPSFHFALDGEFFMRAVGNFRAVRLTDVLATMRVHPASKSVGAGLGFAPEILRVAEKVIDRPSSYPRFEVKPEKVRAAAHYSAARFEMLAGNFRQAAKSLFTSASLSRTVWPTIAGRMAPRLALRALLGKETYLRVGSWVNLRRRRTS